MKTKRWIKMGIIASAAFILVSFINKKEEPKQKKYQVIRSVNGEVFTYDTIVSVNDEMSPTAYLTLLGFDNDKHIEIIHTGSNEMVMMPMGFNGAFSPNPMFNHSQMLSDSMIIIEIKVCDSLINEGESFIWQSDFSDSSMVIIKKNRIIKTVDSLNNEITEIQTLIETMGLDEMNWTTIESGDSTKMMIQTIIIEMDSSDDKNHQQVFIQNGNPPMVEFQEKNVDDLHHLQVFGDNDFTLLIVEEPYQKEVEVKEDKKVMVNPVNHFQVYPNPTNESVQIKLNFNDQAKTTLTITDSNGKTVMKKELGEPEGEFIFNVDVTKWEKGIYYIQIDRPSMKLVEKLVIN